MRGDENRYHFIYKITCVVTGRFYIGMHSTDNVSDGYYGSGKELRKSIARYGLVNHHKNIVQHCETRADLKMLERHIVDEKLLTDPMCMNRTIGGEGGPTRRGMHHTEKSKKRTSIALMGHKVSDETKSKIGAKSKGRGKGKPLSIEHRKKISDKVRGLPSKLIGRPRPDEVRKKISESWKRRSLLHPRYRRPEPKKADPVMTAKKLSDASKRQWADPLLRERMMAARHAAAEKAEMLAKSVQLELYSDGQRIVCTPFSRKNLCRMAKNLRIGRYLLHTGEPYDHYGIPKLRAAEILAKCKIVSSDEMINIVANS